MRNEVGRKKTPPPIVSFSRRDSHGKKSYFIGRDKSVAYFFETVLTMFYIKIDGISSDDGFSFIPYLKLSKQSFRYFSLLLQGTSSRVCLQSSKRNH